MTSTTTSVLARFKLAVVLEAGYARVVKGEADNPKMEAFGDVVLSLAERRPSWPAPRLFRDGAVPVDGRCRAGRLW